MLPKKTGITTLLTALLLLASSGDACALTFNEFSSSVTSTFDSDPFAINRLIAGVSLVVFMFIIYAAFRMWKKQTDQAVDHHYELVKQRHEAYLEALRTGKGQKRQWFRLYSPAEFEWQPPHRPAQGKRPKFKQDRLTDVSAGGIGFTTSEVLEAGDRIKLILYTGEGSPMYLEGRVARVLPDPESGGLVSSAGVAFEGLTEAEQDRMLAWIARRQRDQLSERGGRPPETESQSPIEQPDYWE